MRLKLLLILMTWGLLVTSCKEESESPIVEESVGGDPTIAFNVVSGGTVNDQTETTGLITVSRDGFSLSVTMDVPNGYSSAQLNDNPLQDAIGDLQISTDKKTVSFSETFYLGYSGEKIVLKVNDLKGSSATMEIDGFFEINLNASDITDGSWTLVSDDKGEFIESIFTTADGSLLIVDNGTLFKSTDKGVSGTEIQISEIESIGKIAMHPDGDLYAFEFFSTKIITSSDNGDTWSLVETNIPEGPAIWDIQINSEGMFFAAIHDFFGPGPLGGIWSSTDGITWELKSDELNNQNVKALGILEDSILITGTDWPNGNLYISDDQGETWTQMDSPLEDENSIRDFIITSDNKIFVASAGGIFISEDQGSTFDLLNSGIPVGSEFINVLFEGMDGKIYASPSNYGVFVLEGDSWKSIGTDIADLNVSSFTLIGDQLYVVANPRSLFVLD